MTVTNTWTGGAGDHTWETDGNWDQGHAPLDTENAVLTGSGNIGADAPGTCLGLDATAYTGALNHFYLYPLGPVALGAGGNFSGTRFLFGSGAVSTITTAGATLGNIATAPSSSLTFLSNLTLSQAFEYNGGDVALGARILSTAILDLSENGNVGTWTWTSGKIRLVAGDSPTGIIGHPSVLSDPSLPPIEVAVDTPDLGLSTGDIRVASIDETLHTLTRNGFVVYDPDDVPIPPPSPGPPTYTLTVTAGTGDGDYEEGEVVTILADNPSAGDCFTNWTSSTADLPDAPRNASTTFTMPANAVTLTAHYATAYIPADHIPARSFYLGMTYPH